MDIKQSLEFVYAELSEIHNLRAAKRVLEWDEQVIMPPGGAPRRAEQLATLSTILHKRLTADRFFEAVSNLHSSIDSLDEDSRVNIRELMYAVSRKRAIPSELVQKIAKLQSSTYHQWVQARKNNDDSGVRDSLHTLIKLRQEQADTVGSGSSRYETLLQDFEPHASLEQVRSLLFTLGDSLKGLVPRIAEISAQRQESASFRMPISDQQKLCESVIAACGFDLRRGRLDATAHPFAEHVDIGDTRITTRFFEDNYLSALSSTMHELGHAFYEVGLPAAWAGTPRGESVSLGIHESQSRLWENFIARSRPFCTFLSSFLSKHATSPPALWNALNHVSPSLIRVEADEVSYSLHILIRMTLEEQLINGDLEVADLREAWDTLYLDYLGLRSPNLSNGYLQDVHWFAGMFGYFPTYALGNIFAASLYEKLLEDIPALDEHIASGSFDALRNWNQENIYDRGKALHSFALVENICGRAPEPSSLIAYFENKFLKDTSASD